MEDNNKEYRVFYYSGLICPNPTEHYKNTKVIKKEDDLHFTAELSDLEIETLAIKQQSIVTNYMPVLLIELGILALVLVLLVNNLS